MKLNLQLTAEDYVRACYLNMRPRPVFKWTGYFILLLAVLMLGVAGYQYLAHGEAGVLCLILAGSLIYLAVLFKYTYPKQIRKLYGQQKMLQSPYTVEFTPEGLLTRHETGDSKLTWDYFRKWKEGRELFTVYQSDVLMHIYPKRCFASTAELDEFREMLRLRLGPPVC